MRLNRICSNGYLSLVLRSVGVVPSQTSHSVSPCSSLHRQCPQSPGFKGARLDYQLHRPASAFILVGALSPALSTGDGL